MHAAQAAFIESEAKEKLGGAIRAKIRAATSLICKPGDIVILTEKTVPSALEGARYCDRTRR